MSASTTKDIVAKLWNLCNVLRDDGVSYQEYVTELTYLLFLKMAEETSSENQLPQGWRWNDLNRRSGMEQFTFYREMLIHLGTESKGLVQAVYANANTSLQQPRNLAKLVSDIDGLDWYSAQHEGLGDLYEGLLQKNATESKRGAGQYFTPRPLIDAIVSVLKPKPGEVIQDPAVGTGGFLIAADRHIKATTDDLFDLSVRDQEFQRKEAYWGMELVPSAHRLCLMNCLLHGIEGQISLGDTLSPSGLSLPQADLVLSNPPFGTKTGGGRPTRDDFTYATANKQLAFVQHIYRSLKPGGRAGVVVPDGVLTEGGAGRLIRQDLMNKCVLHTILRLPTGIFYAGGVKTNVLFFTKSARDVNATEDVWVYDLRTDMPVFGKRTPFTSDTLRDFVDVFGADPDGTATHHRAEQDNERWRNFSRKQIQELDDSLDLQWLHSSNQDLDGSEVDPESLLLTLAESLEEISEAVDALLDDFRAPEIERVELSSAEVSAP